MRFLPVLILATALPSGAQSVVSEPIGFNKVTCLANSDTIVGVPLRKEGSRTTKLSGAPTGTGDAITLPVTATLTAGELTKHYVKFTSGTKDGFWYDISSNATDSITIDLNGDPLTGVVSGDSVLIAEYWTLESLFPAAQATTSWAETPSGSGNWTASGHAIVRSDNAITRKTELLVPNYSGTGINLSSSNVFYLLSAGWKKVGSGTSPQDGFILFPDGYVIIRHNASAAHGTVFRSVGEVETGNLAIPISTKIGSKQDTMIGLPRPIPVKLSHLGLDTTVFRNSPNAINRTDELLVFDNEQALKNKSAAAVYYRLSAGWRKIGAGSVDQGDAEIPSGVGFIIRKAATVDGATVFWLNPPNF